MKITQHVHTKIAAHMQCLKLSHKMFTLYSAYTSLLKLSSRYIICIWK